MTDGVLKKVDNRTFTVYRQPNDYGKMTIQSRQVIGGNLKLTATDSTFSLIANGNGVYADTLALGKVIDRGEGYIVVSFVSNPNGATAFTASDFAVGESAIDAGDLGTPNSRVSKDTIFVAPDPFQNIIQSMSQSAQILHDEMHTLTYTPAANGKQYYYYQKEADALQRLYRQYYKRMYTNTAASFNANQPISASPINQILTMGGTSIPLAANASFTPSQFRNWMRSYVNKGGFSTGEIVVVAGPNFLGNFQEAFESANITYVGINNTVGGKEVKGINFYHYSFMGLDLKFMVEPMLGDPQMFPTVGGFSNRSNSALFIDASPVPTKNMGPLPFATCRYFGSTADIQRSVIRGITNENGSSSGVTATNPQAAMSYEFFWNKMVQLSNPANSMYIGA